MNAIIKGIQDILLNIFLYRRDGTFSKLFINSEIPWSGERADTLK
jgi:hypothetical protein